ncbi:hypothetical protein D3OALGA1CA_5087 [Olavius algarvensis associated proteobacterium Delta 3]|nr:hypothetical protein D3OALGA1CA_5087 [Olavius algarvensis associated proteobacterium Delta 3]
MKQHIKRWIRLFLTDFQVTLNFVAVIIIFYLLFLVFIVVESTREFSLTAVITLLSTLVVFFLIRNRLYKIKFGGINAELAEETKKTKSLYWIHKGDLALENEQYEYAEYCFRTALKKNEDVTLSHIGIAKTIRRYYSLDRQINELKKGKVTFDLIKKNFQRAIKLCENALETENKYAEEGGKIDKGPIYLQLALIYYEFHKYISYDKNFYKSIEDICKQNVKGLKIDTTIDKKTIESLHVAKEEFNKTCEIDVIFKKGFEVYQGKDLLRIRLISDKQFCKIEKDKSNLFNIMMEIVEGKENAEKKI